MSTASVTKENWWALVLGGVATLLFGVAAVFWPGLSLLVLLYLFSAYVLISGVVNISAGISTAGLVDSWFLPVALGAFELGVGVYLLRHTKATFATFVILIGFVLIARGIIEGVSTYFLNARTSARARSLSYLSSLGALVAGIVILFSNESNGVSFVWVLGLYAILVGTVNISQLQAGSK